jgi:quinoprotein glucose dehydrogenase
VRQTLVTGKGRMVPLPHLTDTEIDQVVGYLMSPGPGGGRGRGRGAAPAPTFPEGPVVGSGSAKQRPPRGRGAPMPYPEGVADFTRYTINAYGTIGDMMKPPYTTIVKYDLNEPAIKWRVGLGDDPRLAASGLTGTGMTQMRNSILVTSTGLIFGPGNDNKIRAYSTDTGEILWTGSFAGTFRGSPVIYVYQGREYLLVPAAGDQEQHGNQAPPYGTPEGPLGYVAFALPR